MKTLVVLQGPTGVGKTELSLNLAEFFHSPILNADSRQIYKEIPIGTAAPTLEEQQRVKHYFVGTLSVQDYYSAARYEADALAVCEQLFQTHDVLILSGGSMLYVDAVCRGIDDIPTVDADTRQFIVERYEKEGLAELARELRLRDPEYYAICDVKNTKRVLHALEICYMTGKTYTSFRVRQPQPRPFRVLKIGLQREREQLYERINLRVEHMMQQGWLEEARAVYPLRQLNSLNTVGYKELFQYFDGAWTLDFAKEKISRNTRVYSRKQMTWLRRDGQINWFMPEQSEEIRNFIINKMYVKD